MTLVKKKTAEERAARSGEEDQRAARLFAFARDGVYGLSARSIKSCGECRAPCVLTVDTL
jgi:hypothetical protein